MAQKSTNALKALKRLAATKLIFCMILSTGRQLESIPIFLNGSHDDFDVLLQLHRHVFENISISLDCIKNEVLVTTSSTV